MIVIGKVKKAGRKTSFFKRGALFVALLALGAGIVTGATSWATGESVQSGSQAVAEDAYAYPQEFDSSLGNALTTLGNNPDNTTVTSTFYESYVSVSQAYSTSLLSAAQTYSETYQANPAEARDAYIDAFNRAADQYFNQLEAARNTVVTELSGKDDVAKDMFVNEYNKARDIYRGQIESLKGQLSQL